MNWYLTAAALLAFFVGLVHSVLGEHLLFRHMRAGTFVPTNGLPVLGERHVRILWGSWHLVTVMGWCIGAVLILLARTPPTNPLYSNLATIIIATTLVSSLLVCVATKGRHPGWIGLLLIALLTLAGR
ncbi:MAG: hypothetical protein ABI120_04015 [Gemmatimonadaceae bacterium]